MKNITITARLAALACAVSPAAHAQMVSAADMGFVRTEVSRDFGYAEAGYTFAPKLAAGAAWYRIGGDCPTLNAYTANVNWLAWRENAAGWQTNVYLGAGAGGLVVNGRNEEAVGVGLFQADWENRRWHLMYQSQILANDRRFHVANTMHAGWAPWLAEYDEVSPWIYLRAFYVTGRGSPHVDFAPTLALMYKDLFLEAGVDLKGYPVLGLRYLFSF